MNCYKCGKEIVGKFYLRSAGYICQPCFDEEEIQKAEINAGKASGKIELSPREAIIAMLDGETLITAKGDGVTWNKKASAFIFTETNTYLCTFNTLFRKPKKKTRPMDSFECLAWASSPESHGWMVSINTGPFVAWEPGDIPQRFRYDGKEGRVFHDTFSYRRAKILPDRSGIDESTIQGFVVEEE